MSRTVLADVNKPDTLDTLYACMGKYLTTEVLTVFQKNENLEIDSRIPYEVRVTTSIYNNMLDTFSARSECRIFTMTPFFITSKLMTNKIGLICFAKVKFSGKKDLLQL